MTIIRRYSLPIALLAAFAAAIAAPYLVPIDPDSAVFRSGVLGAALIAASVYPAYRALRRADGRTLACGAACALLLSCALGVGSELFVYDGLLRGMGSAVRRAAVPVLATPLLGALCARAMLVRLPVQRPARRIPMFVFALAFLVCWLPVLLAYFPGMPNYDIVAEYNQQRQHTFYAINPLLYSVIELGLINFGELLRSATFGLLLTSVARMVSFAFALAYACDFAQRRGAPRPALLLAAAYFALHPVFSVMSVSTNKDVPFASALLVLSLLSCEWLRDPQAFWQSGRRRAMFVLMAVLTAHMRKNGVFALALLLPGLVLALRGQRARAALLCGLSAACCALLQFGLTAALSPVPQPAGQLYSLPAQQLVRAYNAGDFTPEDAAELEGWYLFPTGLNIYPHNADRAKNNLDDERLTAHGDEFLALWARNARSHLHEYTEAFLMLNMGLWYPDDLSHSTVYHPVNYDPPGYLETDLFVTDMPEFETVCLLPRVREIVEKVCTQNAYQAYPVVSVLFCTATPFWVLVFSVALLIARRRGRLAVCALGVLGIWLSYLFGPCTLPRYVLPLFCLAPALLLAALTDTPKEAAP